ncbi:MAG: autotransporter-associated beta strand repeat-containing protein [Akkermansiaceae bacterium]|nr:autotransporter-associated beta strand repeat-containing protein [Akkermansiaceae bacterium]
MKPKFNTAIFRNSSVGIPLVTAIVVSFGLSAAYAADWTGGTSTEWNTGSNWSGGSVPTGQNAIINNSSGNIATISANLSVTPNDIDVRNGSRLDHVAGTAGTNGGSWMFVGQDNSAGTYNLANTGSAGAGITGFAQGTGSLNATGNLLVGAYGDNRTGTVRVNTSGTLAVSGELFIGDSQNSTANFLLESGTMTANNKIFVGNNKANGTLTMSGGTLTKTGGDETFVGRDQGTGTITQSGGTLTLNHNLYVGQSSGSTGTYNISGSSVLNVARDFVVGRESGTGTLNMTGGTITKTGDEKFIVGHNNGVGTVVQSGGTISANNELYIGNENASASGTYTLSGTGALNISNEVVVGRESGTGVLNVNGGTLTTSGNGNMYIGRRNGTGTLNQSAGTISVNKEFGVGTRDDNKIGTGTYNLSGGLLTASNNIFIGKEEGASGTMTMTGGTMTGSDKLIIGHNRASGSLSHSAGTVNVQNEVYIGNENSASSVGTYTLSGSAVLNVGNEVQVGRDNGTGTFNLNGGTVTTKKIEGGNGSATVNFNGGIVKAKQDESNFITNLDTANLQGGGAVINSDGYQLATSQVFTGTGGITKNGAGTLTLSSTSSFSGATTVAGGTLVISGNISTSSLTTVNSGATLSGSGTVGAAVINGTLAVGNSPGQMNFTNTVDLNGITVMEIDGTSGAGVAGGHDFINLTGAGAAGVLTYGGTLTLDIGTAFGVGSYSWNLFDFASETDTLATISLTDQYAGSLLDGDLNGIWDLTSGGNSWQFTESTGVLGLTVIPEPSAALLGGLGVLALLRRRRTA